MGTPFAASVTLAAQALRRGGTVVFPTETVYGLGANALDPEACARIFEIKGRPRFNPLIVHLADPGEIDRVAAATPQALELAARFWPGPLTLVLPRRDAVDGIVSGGLPTIGVRIPAHPVARALIAEAGVPVAAPSANKYMSLSPTTVAHAQAQLGNAVDAYVDGGPCTVGVESTIIGWIDGRATLLRPGGLDPREIEQITGPLARVQKASGVLAPGMTARHYAPRVQVKLIDGAVPDEVPGRTGLLCLSATEEDRARGLKKVAELSPAGDLRVAAAHLFSAMHELEGSGLELIVARLVPEVGLGIAINDRLRRAAAEAE